MDDNELNSPMSLISYGDETPTFQDNLYQIRTQLVVEPVDRNLSLHPIKSHAQIPLQNNQ